MGAQERTLEENLQKVGRNYGGLWGSFRLKQRTLLPNSSFIFLQHFHVSCLM